MKIRTTKPDIEIKQGFTVIVEPAEDIPGVWVAIVRGLDPFDLSYEICTQGDSPTHAVFMAYDALTLMTGECTGDGHRKHHRIDHGFCSACGLTTTEALIEVEVEE